MNFYEEEISKKVAMLNVAAIEVCQDRHIRVNHIAKSDKELVERMRKNEKKGAKKVPCSTFFSENDINNALYEYFTDSYALKKVVKWLEDEGCGDRYEDNAFSFNDEPIGRILRANGALKNVYSYRIILEKNDRRNGAAGMPFNVVTLYPVNDD